MRNTPTNGKERSVGHTPGPWKLVEVSTDEYELWSNDDEVLIAVLETPEPDARLVAAAPDLLESLRDLLDAYKAPIPSYEDGEAHYGTVLACESLAREAIAKATGEAPHV